MHQKHTPPAQPKPKQKKVARLDADVSWARALDGSEYMPGLVGLNNLKASDYVNVVLQVLARVQPVRDFFLLPENYAGCKAPVVARFGELMRKAWNAANFKGQVSPHELVQAVILASGRRFTADSQVRVRGGVLVVVLVWDKGCRLFVVVCCCCVVVLHTPTRIPAPLLPRFTPQPPI
jgi:hypothetical protein